MVNYVINAYKRGYSIMGKNKKENSKGKNTKQAKNKPQDSNIDNKENDIAIHNVQTQSNIRKKNKHITKYLVEIIIGSIIIPFCGFMGKLMWDFNTNLSSLQATVSSMQKDISDIQESVKPIPAMQTDIALLKEKDNSFASDLNGFKNTKSDSSVFIPATTLKKQISNATTNNNDFVFLQSLQLDDNSNIAKNPHTGRKYKPKDLRDKKILLPYTENGQDIYFYGQFNKYNHWDGNCIINIYKNNKLNMIMEGRYTDGKLISYKQVFYYKNSSNKLVWSISNREISDKDEVNNGETYTYFKKKNKKSNFNQKTVEPSDILSIEDFEVWLNTPLEGYYYGNTSEGKYNDNTGHAYLVKYFKDGTVRTIYCGKFKNGLFEDHTKEEDKKAWYISRDNEYKTYVYYKGEFSNNNPCETENNKRENITNKEIHEIIDNMNFNCDITLRGDNNSPI